MGDFMERNESPTDKEVNATDGLSGRVGNRREWDWRQASIGEMMAYMLVFGVGMAFIKSHNEKTAEIGFGLVAMALSVGSLKVVYMFLGKIGLFVAVGLFLIAFVLWPEMFDSVARAIYKWFDAQSDSWLTGERICPVLAQTINSV